MARTQPTPAPAASAGEAHADEPETFSLGKHWELDADSKRGVFAFRPHNQNYLLTTYNSSPNTAPYLPFKNLSPGAKGLSRSEIAFQLGFKMKMLEDITDQHADLWFGYTQQSYWQAYNRGASSAFRETNYQPELMAVVPVNFNVLGMKARFVNFGFVHQSNGQASTLSRSWNRLYVQAGLEKDNVTVLARVWKRLDERRADDDNPDMVDYMGHGDIEVKYRADGHEMSLLARRNFHTGRGALQAGWALPLSNQLKGYLQVFSGYGQSLIDYNYSQKSIGLGFLLSY